MTVTRTTTSVFEKYPSGALSVSPTAHIFDDDGTANNAADQAILDAGRAAGKVYVTKAEHAAQAPAEGTQTRPKYGSLISYAAGK